jgi:hypothetical protein
MSKKAEELARRIDDMLEQGGMGTKGLSEAAELIDATLREEREKAALRNCKRCMPCGYSQCPQEHNCPTRAAILTDEED